MATSNLISKSLGGVLQETGNGSPDHTSPRGSTYVDQLTGVIYYNTNGGNTWVDVNKNSYGNMFVTGNTVAVTGVTTNTWYSLSGATWTGGTTDGITYSAINDTLIVNVDRGGKYLIIGNGRINRQTANAIYQLGISINALVPSDGYYQSSCTVATETTSSISVIGVFNLNSNDSVQLSVRNTSTTNNILISESSLTLIKIGNI